MSRTIAFPAEKEYVKMSSRSDSVTLYPIGDVHAGKANCMESALRKHVAKIVDTPNAYVLLGGDLIDCIHPADVKRFEFSGLAEWLVTKEALGNIVQAQVNWIVDLLKPLAAQGKIIGALEGNHEHQYHKRHNHNVHAAICWGLGVPELTGSAYIRMQFSRSKNDTIPLKIFCQHESGCGRKAGASHNSLEEMGVRHANMDLCLEGHNHTCAVGTPIVQPDIPSKGRLSGVFAKYVHVYNWGSWLLSSPEGPSLYEERARYPLRPSYTVAINIKPFASSSREGVQVFRPEISATMERLE
jgi:hypothetical protein